MIDFHTHILPNVDDGAKTIDDTYKLLEEAKKAGFDSVISTSHYMEEYYEVNVETREKLIQEISNEISNRNIDLKLYLGNEIYITENIVNLLKEKKATTINDTKYVLFEFPLNIKPMNMFDIIYDMLEYKVVPILAHPERYSFIQKEPDIVYDLIEAGALMQVNYGSILGMYGESARFIARKLFENDMVHFLGSDIHRVNSIYPKVPEALSRIKEIIGEDKLEELTTINPGLVLENKSLDIYEPSKIKLSLTEKIKLKMKK